MYYDTRRACKTVAVKPFVIMSGQSSLYGMFQSDIEEIFSMKIGLVFNSTGRHNSRAIAQSSNVIVVHNFTNMEMVTVDPAGIRSGLSPEPIAYHSQMFGSKGTISDQVKLKLQEKCELQNLKLANKVAIFKFVSIVGRDHQEARRQVEYTKFPEDIKQTILSCEPINIFKSHVFSYAYEFMLVYLIDVTEFDKHHTVVEPQTQSCITKLKMDDAYGHPLDMRPQTIDVTALIETKAPMQPLYMNAEIVYHISPYETRYINMAGRVLELPQVKDTTRPPGFHFTDFHIVEGYRGMDNKKNYLPLNELTEANGFYKTLELAYLRKTTEQAQKTNEELGGITDQMKALRVVASKDLDSFTKTSIDKLLQLTERSLGENRAYAEKKHAEYAEGVFHASKTIEKLQEELRDNKRTHETAMQSRKEMLETIRLIPPLLGCIAAVMAFKKKNQS